jgi:hypothetical protein
MPEVRFNRSIRKHVKRVTMLGKLFDGVLVQFSMAELAAHKSRAEDAALVPALGSRNSRQESTCPNAGEVLRDRPAKRMLCRQAM